MWKCSKCEGYRFSKVEVCHCKLFKVIGRDGDNYDVYAMDSESAALKFAEESNENGDYYLMGESAIIEVDGVKFEIGAEPDIHYSAEALG